MGLITGEHSALTKMKDFCNVIFQVGYAVTTYGQTQDTQDHTHSSPVIGFDMGGTSTDVSRYAGEYEHVFESNVSGVKIQAPQVNHISKLWLRVY